MTRGLVIASVAVLVSGAASMLAGCNSGVNGAAMPPLRYRLVATVQTPEGERTGSSVLEVKSFIGSSARIMPGSDFSLAGEAVMVDLPRGQTVFILLRSPNNLEWAAWAINYVSRAVNPSLDQDPQPTDRSQLVAWSQRRWSAMQADRGVHYVWGGDVPIERANYLPYVVRFRDVAEPTSVEQLNPTNFSAEYGKGYKFKSLTVQVTTDPVTSRIGNKLHWLGQYPEPRLMRIPPGGVVNPLIAQRLAHGDFRRGVQ